MIVIVRISTPYPLRKARSEIEREKENPPALILVHMLALMSTMCFEREMIRSEYHVAKGDRLKLHRTGQQTYEGSQFPARYFDYTVSYTDCCTETASEHRDEATDNGRRRRPHVGKGATCETFPTIGCHTNYYRAS